MFISILSYTSFERGMEIERSETRQNAVRAVDA